MLFLNNSYSLITHIFCIKNFIGNNINLKLFLHYIYFYLLFSRLLVNGYYIVKQTKDGKTISQV